MTSPIFVHIDYETRSECDIKLGVTKYAMHPSTEVLCLGCCIGGHPTIITDSRAMTMRLSDWVLAVEYPHRSEKNDLGVFFVAHNAAFERAVTEYTLGIHIPIDRWICTAAMSRHFGLPGSLDGAAAALKLPVRKSDNTAMKKLCKPLPDSAWVRKNLGMHWYERPENWPRLDHLNPPDRRKAEKYKAEHAALYEELYKYCMQDVEVEKQLFHALPALSPRERRLWVLDAKINKRGIPVDVELAARCNELSTQYVSQKIRELPRITGGVVQTPKQTAKMLEWMHVEGIHLDNLQAQTVQDALQTELPLKVQEVLEIRAATAGNAHSKFSKFVTQAGPDWRIRDSFIYYGSHTGRWTSEGTQTNNIMRPEVKNAEQFAEQFKEAAYHGDFFDHLSKEHYLLYEKWTDTRKKDNKPVGPEAFYRAVRNSLVRSVICAKPRKVLIAEDYSQVEARGAAWLAGAHQVIEAYLNKVCLYKRTASGIFGIPENEIDKESFQRWLGKKIYLGGQYGIGAEKFHLTCLREGAKIEMELAERSVTGYRETYPEIPALWREFDSALYKVFVENEPTWIQNKVLMRREVFNNVVFMTLLLPSGRTLYYPQAEYKQTLKKVKEYVGGKWTGQMIDRLTWSFSYYGRIQGKQYGRVHTWGGGLTENVVQAFCRDLLCTAMLQIDREKICDIIMHVYDEIVVEVDEDKAEEVQGRIEEIMRAGALWSEGLPLDCEGWIGKRYKK